MPFEAKQDFSFYARKYRKGQQYPDDAFTADDGDALVKAGRLRRVEVKADADEKQQQGRDPKPDGGKPKGS